MRGFPTRAGVAVLLCFVVVLRGADLGHAGGAIEMSEDAESSHLLPSGRISTDIRAHDVGSWDDPKFSCRRTMARRLGSRRGPSPPSPTINKMKSMVYIAPPPPEDQLL